MITSLRERRAAMNRPSGAGASALRILGQGRWRATCPVFGFVLVLIGCFGTANLIPKSVDFDPKQASRIHAGRGVRFRAVDGARVQAANVLVLPGEHHLRFDVRRGLKGLDEERLEGIYEVGTCRIIFDTKPEGHYEVLTRVFAEDRYQIIEDVPTADGSRQIVGLTVHVIDLDTGKDVRAAPEACELELDCHKIDRFSAKPGSECNF